MAKKKQSKRCEWIDLKNPDYVRYHDEEWGVPVHDDRKHFEMILLEGAQAGLSWATILKKREGYRKAFAEFDPVKVARFREAKLEKLMLDSGIVRNRLKIWGARETARAFLKVQKEFGSFDAFIWEFVGGKPLVNRWKSLSQIPANTEASDAMSKELKRRGFKFVGSTICYAYTQAAGLVNDHEKGCSWAPQR